MSGLTIPGNCKTWTYILLILFPFFMAGQNINYFYGCVTQKIDLQRSDRLRLAKNRNGVPFEINRIFKFNIYSIF